MPLYQEKHFTSGRAMPGRNEKDVNRDNGTDLMGIIWDSEAGKDNCEF